MARLRRLEDESAASMEDPPLLELTGRVGAIAMVSRGRTILVRGTRLLAATPHDVALICYGNARTHRREDRLMSDEQTRRLLLDRVGRGTRRGHE